MHLCGRGGGAGELMETKHLNSRVEGPEEKAEEGENREKSLQERNNGM